MQLPRKQTIISSCYRPVQRENNRGAKGIIIKPTYKGVVGQPVEFIGELTNFFF